MVINKDPTTSIRKHANELKVHRTFLIFSLLAYTYIITRERK